MPRLIEKPEIFLIQRPSLDWGEIRRYLQAVGGEAENWADRVEGIVPDGEALVEFMGRMCYRSWEPGLNPNVTKVRKDSESYLGNILSSGHGSVTEHANFSFIFHNVSRVFTHEMVRHRAGVAVSQESMRFVRLDDLPFWFPEWARGDDALMQKALDLLEQMEEFQGWMAEHFGLDATKPCPSLDHGTDHSPAPDCERCDGVGEIPAVPMSEKKAKTSFMRRFAPDGVSTGIGCTINIRAIRHIIYMRTALGAEEEIRLVFDEVARLALDAFPNLMQDYSPNENAEWVPAWLKV